jgi:hypothetical protein
MQLSQSQLARLWVQAGGDPGKAGEASAIAMAESSGNTASEDHDGDGSTDLGPWQVNNHAHSNYNEQSLRDNPLYNAKAAVAISNNGTDFGPWVTFKTGAYKKFLSGYRGPSRAGVTLPGTSGEKLPKSGGGVFGVFDELGPTLEIVGNPIRLGKIVLGGVLLIIALDRLSGIKAIPIPTPIPV